MGTYSFPKRGLPGSDPVDRNSQAIKVITFPRKFSKPPKVIVWLTGFDVEHAKGDFELFVQTGAINDNNFELKCLFSEGKAYRSIDVNWVAYPQDAQGVASGLSYMHGGKHVKEDRVSFGSGIFDDPPRVFAALSGVEIEGEDLRVDVATSDVSDTGFEWRAQTWDDSEAGSVWFNWIAFA